MVPATLRKRYRLDEPGAPCVTYVESGGSFPLAEAAAYSAVDGRPTYLGNYLVIRVAGRPSDL
jgi:hypothetical protein